MPLMGDNALNVVECTVLGAEGSMPEGYRYCCRANRIGNYAFSTAPHGASLRKSLMVA